MKTAFTLLLSAFTLGAAQAQTPVTFAVDMNGVSEFRPDRDTLRLAGSLQSPSVWTPREASGNNILTDPDGNGVYSLTYNIAPGSYEWKYVINIWNPDGFNEASGATPVVGDASCFTSDNRTLTVGATAMTLPVFRYNSCAVSNLPISSGLNDFGQLRGVSVGPNPMTDLSTVVLPAGGNYDIRVLGIDGREISKVSGVRSSTHAIERGDFAQGLYVVEVVETQRGERAVIRLAVQ